MREEFLEPLPSLQRSVTLVLGTSKVECYLVEVTATGYRVAVPGVAAYEGDPRMMLVIDNRNHPVRLTRQLPHAGGYSYNLEKIKEVPLADHHGSQGKSRDWRQSLCCAAILMLTVGLSYHFVVNANVRSELVSLDGIRQDLLALTSQSNSKNNQAASGSTSNRSFASNSKSTTKGRARKARSEVQPDSVISSASLSSGVELSTATSIRQTLPNGGKTAIDDLNPGHGLDHAAKSLHSKGAAKPTLKSMLDAGRTGRIQSVDHLTVPWLFQSGQFADDESMRMSDAAWVDLKQFEFGLKHLPKQVSDDAIASLQETLILVNSGEVTSHSVPGMRDVLVVTSADANIYFRSVQGRTELIRILPIESN